VSVGDRVLFASGQSTLNPRGEEVLGRVIAALGSLSDRRIRIEGHTDSTPVAADGSFPTNWELSTARATTVVRFLEAQGVAGDRLVAVGYGPHRPVGDNRTANGRQRNRRIEIVLERESRTRPPG
jgi:chemotaxis protein MotB